MENTGIGREREEFVSRKSYEEFHRDGEVIEELYEWVDGLMADEYEIPYGEYTLQVFNHAYRICWMLVNNKGSVRQINSFLMDEKEVVKEYSLTVAYALLLLHKEFYPLKDDFHEFFSGISIEHECCCLAFAKRYKLSSPVDFSTPLPDSLDFIQEEDDVFSAMDKATRMEKEIEKLHRQLEVERGRTEVAEQAVVEKQAKLDAWENDAFYKAVNINTILKYAQESGICDNNDIKTIRMMLVELCANKVPNEVIEKIKTLKLGGTIYIEKQENHGCQNFYGDISDSSFPTRQ